jgi:hypothetical protein
MENLRDLFRTTPLSCEQLASLVRKHTSLVREHTTVGHPVYNPDCAICVSCRAVDASIEKDEPVVTFDLDGPLSPNEVKR